MRKLLTLSLLLMFSVESFASDVCKLYSDDEDKYIEVMGNAAIHDAIKENCKKGDLLVLTLLDEGNYSLDFRTIAEFSLLSYEEQYCDYRYQVNREVDLLLSKVDYAHFPQEAMASLRCILNDNEPREVKRISIMKEED